MTETPPDWVTNVPSTQSIHNIPAGGFQPTGLTEDQLKITRDKFNEMILQIVTMSTAGSFIPTGNIGDAGDQLSDWATGVQDAADTALFSTETIQGFFSTPRVLPAYVGSLSDEVAFDKDGIDGTTAPTLGTIVLIPVMITQDRVIDAIKIGCTATTMTNLYIGLYDCNETTGNLGKVLDLGDRKADLDTAFGQQTFELDEAVSIQRGELYFISVLQVGGTAAAMHRKSLSTNFTTGLFPKHMGSTWATTGVSALPTTIVDADVVSGTRFWGSLGTAIAPVAPGGVFLQDSFNRPDNGSVVGPQWTIRDGAGGISGNKPLASLFATVSVTNNTRLSATSQRAGFTQSLTGASDRAIALRGNGLGPYVELMTHVIPAGGGSPATYHAYIMQRSTYNRFTSGTQRASFSGGSNSSSIVGQWIFEASGNTYTGYLNGVVKLQWVDSGGAFPVASNNTEVGFHTAENITPTFDDWYAQDL